MNVEPKKMASPTAAANELLRGMILNAQNATMKLAAGPAKMQRQNLHLSALRDTAPTLVAPLARLCRVHCQLILPERSIRSGPTLR